MIPGLVQGGLPMVTSSASIRRVSGQQMQMQCTADLDGRPLFQEIKCTKLGFSSPAFQLSRTPVAITMNRSNTAAADLTKRC